MNYVGIDWAYGRAAFCAMGEGGEIQAEGLISADEDGLAKLVLRLGTETKAAVEMMSGAVWVRESATSERLAGAGRPRPQGEGRRPARLQDGSGRRPGAGGASPARAGPGALAALGRGPSPARAPTASSPPGGG